MSICQKEYIIHNIHKAYPTQPESIVPTLSTLSTCPQVEKYYPENISRILYFPIESRPQIWGLDPMDPVDLCRMVCFHICAGKGVSRGYMKTDAARYTRWAMPWAWFEPWIHGHYAAGCVLIYALVMTWCRGSQVAYVAWRGEICRGVIHRSWFEESVWESGRGKIMSWNRP
jgi:hypothetical protein